MFKRSLIIALVLVLVGSLKLGAQDLSMSMENGTNLNVLYRNDASAKIYAATRGYGFLFRRGKHVNAKLRSYYEVDAQTLRYPKEIRILGESPDRRRFVYGKINSVLLVRGALGLQQTIFAKADMKAVEVRCSYSIGPTLGFAKPYYIQVYKTVGAGVHGEPSLAVFDDKSFTDASVSAIRVTGRGRFVDGLEQTKVYPAVTGKFNLSFEYAPYTNIIRAIETGVTVDYFPKALPLMARNPAENIIIALHVGFVFGKKWF